MAACWFSKPILKGLSQLFVLTCTGCAGIASQQVTIVETRYVGVVANPRAPYLVRDGGASAVVGKQILWTFGDTLFPQRSVDGTNLRSNTAALADLSDPIHVTEPLDENGAPFAFLPFTPEEQRYNEASGRPDDRFALWPTGVIPIGRERALVFYNRLKIHPGVLNYEGLSTGLAEVQAGSTTARRLTELFTVPEPQFHHAPMVKDGMLHLYACELQQGQVTSWCRIARAPLEQAANRAAYEFWNGSRWHTDIREAILAVPGSTSGFSVAWNPYLGAFVSVYSTAFDKRVMMRTAPEPYGPWSEAIEVIRAEGSIYAVYQHPGLAKEDGRRIFVSYYLPRSAFEGEIRLYEVTLREVGLWGAVIPDSKR